MDVPVILQLKFLHSYENEEVPQFPFLDRVLQLPVVLQNVQCKLCKSWRFHRAVLRRCLRAVCCALTGAGDGQTVQKFVKFPRAFLDKVVLPVVMQDRRLSRQCRKP